MLGVGSPTGMAQPSKTQIDRLGDRLKKGPAEKSDLIALDTWRRSFGPAYDSVVQTIRDQLKLNPSGRPAKSTNSLVEKLKRESIRLTQVQDIAGCRVVVRNVPEQDWVAVSLAATFSGASIVDRREITSYGYRAVHIIADVAGKLVEIQVRTELQHMWAELSEKYADIFGSEIKYGGGASEIRKHMEIISESVAEYEETERKFAKATKSDKVKDIQKTMDLLRKEIAKLLDEEFAFINLMKGKEE